MQDGPLTLPSVVERAESYFFDKTLVGVTADGVRRVTYGDWADRVRRLAGALDGLGIDQGAPVGTLAWNTLEHQEIYLAAPCSGRVLHTVNARLHRDQMVHIINHAKDEIIFVDHGLMELFLPLLADLPGLRHVVVMGGEGDLPGGPGARAPVFHRHDELVASAEPAGLHVPDERQAAAMSYTSGTTGLPKGVVYSHRSTFLHMMALQFADGMGIRESDVLMPVLPMFHGNGAGFPFAAPATGASLILIGRDHSPEALAGLIESERASVVTAVPTVWSGLLPALAGRDTTALRILFSGGTPPPPGLQQGCRAATGLDLVQGYGGTEFSPFATVCAVKSTLRSEPQESIDARRRSIGIPQLGVQMRVVGVENRLPVEWDGQTVGEIEAGGPWIAGGYHDDDRSAQSFTADGWLRTGDLAVVDQHGYITIVDRVKDVIKSGGEWISSSEMERMLLAHPGIAEAAVVAVRHPKWDERPLACVVARGDELTSEEVLAHLEGRIPRWWMPDAVVILDGLPMTAGGKVSKKTLRETYADILETSTP